ncbi:MAG: D-lactate dehydrogenase VanH-A [Mailhella sp.]|nr:D-lactate dehydrogenase VanH-A [Mailhella sp.]
MKLFFYCLREFDELAFCRQFSRQLGIDFDYTTEYPSPKNYELVKGCEAVSVIPCDMSAPVLRSFCSLGVKYLLCRSIGYDHVDLDEAERLGMRVANVSYPPTGVANYAVMLMLMACRKITHVLRQADMQNFTLNGKIGLDISACTVGVIGTGQIGMSVMRVLSGFGCRILACDPHKNPHAAGLAEYVSLDRLIAESDIITLHTNATSENYHMLNAEAFSRMKSGVIIINTARGKLIDTDALVNALESGKVGFAALDVLEKEDGLYYCDRTGDTIANRDMAVLRSFPNVILSPHTAFYTKSAVEHMVKYCFTNAAGFADGSGTDHEVTHRSHH